MGRDLKSSLAIVDVNLMIFMQVFAWLLATAASAALIVTGPTASQKVLGVAAFSFTQLAMVYVFPVLLLFRRAIYSIYKTESTTS